MKKPKIIFYQSKDQVPSNLQNVQFITGQTSTEERADIIQRFNAGKIKILAVPKLMVTGWRAEFFTDEVNVEFYGDFSENEKYQAKNRGKIRL